MSLIVDFNCLESSGVRDDMSRGDSPSTIDKELDNSDHFSPGGDYSSISKRGIDMPSRYYIALLVRVHILHVRHEERGLGLLNWNRLENNEFQEN
jgi:hypothetical protein